MTIAGKRRKNEKTKKVGKLQVFRFAGRVLPAFSIAFAGSRVARL
jgi:hypothetical protein